MANSALDRLPHKARPFVLKGDSYRKRRRPQTDITPGSQTESTDAQSDE
jgi:hypothetical protein